MTNWNQISAGPAYGKCDTAAGGCVMSKKHASAVSTVPKLRVRTGKNMPKLRVGMPPKLSQPAIAQGFTLIELLIVIAILALLLTILVPALQTAKEQTKITAVNAELYTIGLALEAYGLENKENFPPTYVSCMSQSHYYQLPKELVNTKYLPGKRDKFGPMATILEDRFNPGHTYKYAAPGDLIINQGQKPVKHKSKLWVPDGFPDAEQETGQFYRNPRTSPVTWTVYSLGPNFDPEDPFVIDLHYPVPKDTWYDPEEHKGFFTRIRLLNGKQVGTFRK
jgi:prepilin-type N-terminal cleavage/methylation domain-containing protein